MLPRDVGMLQKLPAQRPRLANPAALGAARTGESGATGEVGRGSGDVAGAGNKFGDGGGGYCRCGEDTDCEWESYCLGHWAGAEGSGGSGYGASEAIIDCQGRNVHFTTMSMVVFQWPSKNMNAMR